MENLEAVRQLKLTWAVIAAVVIAGGAVAQAVELSELGKKDDKGG